MSLNIPYALSHKYSLDKGTYPGPNLCRDGSLSSMSLMSPAMGWGTIWGVHLTYDGNQSNWAARTGGAGNHAGLGAQINFSSPKALKAIHVHGSIGSFPTCTYLAQYHNGSSWVTVSTQTGAQAVQTGGTVGGAFVFNEDGNITASSWRWYMSTYVYTYSNFYLYEIEAYDKLKYT